jgi:diguanylate cyclase (GGDEF)-like protein
MVQQTRMGQSPHDILNEARRSLEKSGVDENDRKELITLLDILVSAAEQTGSPEDDKGEISRSLATSLVSSQALLTLLKQQTAELDALRKLSLNLTSSLDMPTVLDAIAHEAMRLVPNTLAVHIFLYRNGLLQFGSALQNDGSTRVISQPRKNGLTYAVVREACRIIVEDIHNHPLYANAPNEWSGSIIGIPLKMGDAILGVMNLSRSIIGGFTESETRLLDLLADQAAVAISNASLHQLISHKAYSDTVTGLPNRRALDERLERELLNARRTEQPFGLVMMDLDGFKNVNDTYGHAMGDQVLRVFFSYMAQGLRATDFLARYGGDELTLLMSQTNLQSALSVTGKINEKIRKFFFTAPDGKKIRIGLSGGVAIYPTHGRTAPDLLRAADEALYRAKRHQRGTFVVAKAVTGQLSPPSLHTNE